jgi:hypothetical protein
MERCHETSHAPPMVADVTASTPHQTYQGTVGASAEARVIVDVAIKTSQNLNESYFLYCCVCGPITVVVEPFGLRFMATLTEQLLRR